MLRTISAVRSLLPRAAGVFSRAASRPIVSSSRRIPTPLSSFRALCTVPDGILRSKNWHDMPLATRALWSSLGWSASTWSNGPNPPSDSLDWEDLSDEEQQAASMLGYTESTWNNEGFGNPFHGSSTEGWSREQGRWDNPIYPMIFFGALIPLLWWHDEQQWRRVELSAAQKDELRELVTSQDLPNAIKVETRAAGYRDSLLLWFRSANEKHKRDVADTYLKQCVCKRSRPAD